MLLRARAYPIQCIFFRNSDDEEKLKNTLHHDDDNTVNAAYITTTRAFRVIGIIITLWPQCEFNALGKC